MDPALTILLQQLVDGQTSMNTRLGAIEKYMAEKKGERKMALWLFGTMSGVAGSAMTTFVARIFGHKGP